MGTPAALKKERGSKKMKPLHKRAKYRGVWNRPSGRYAASITIPNTRKARWLGTFDTADLAAAAYDFAARFLYGLNARTNFDEPTHPGSPLYSAVLTASRALTAVDPHFLDPGVTGVSDHHGLRNHMDWNTAFSSPDQSSSCGGSFMVPVPPVGMLSEISMQATDGIGRSASKPAQRRVARRQSVPCLSAPANPSSPPEVACVVGDNPVPADAHDENPSSTSGALGARESKFHEDSEDEMENAKLLLEFSAKAWQEALLQR